jgi:hypothetical protein
MTYDLTREIKILQQQGYWILTNFIIENFTNVFPLKSPIYFIRL